VVVAVGCTEVEPVADEEVKVPGEIEIVVAPDVDQFSALLEPEVMLVGLAAKDEMEGAEPLPDEPDDPDPVEPEPEEPVDDEPDEEFVEFDPAV
jgi:hypothetical protein